VKVDASSALAMPGVVDFVSRADVPGSNLWNYENDDVIFAEEEVCNVPKLEINLQAPGQKSMRDK
jgi:xanthine dehydrogenase/oxidase